MASKTYSSGGTSPGGTSPRTQSAARLPALDPNTLHDITSRRRLATADLERAEANFAASSTRARARSKLERAMNVKSAGDQQKSMLQGFADRGMARNPRTAGVGARRIRDALSDQQSAGSADLAERIASLSQVRDQARRDRDWRIAQLERDEVAARGNWQTIMGG